MFGQDQLDIAEAQAEAVIRPNGMLDDLARKAEAAVRIAGGCRHPE